MGKILLSLALAAAFALPSFAQDIVILKDGTSVDAKVIEVDDNSVRYKKFNNPDGPTYTAKKETISEIRYKNGSKEIFNQAKATSPDKNPNSVWWTKARETKLGFWMDPLGCAQWGPMAGVSIRMGTNFDIKAHVRIYYKDFPLANEDFKRHHFDNGVGFGLEFSKLFATTHGNWHAGLLLETAIFEANYEYNLYYNGRYDNYKAPHFALYTIAATGGYTLRFSNRFFIDFSLQTGVSVEYTDYVNQLFYADASLKLGIEL
ncbi:hypothetical protein [uncultured Fibrobacter sp.]|uniref:hypothetical protein n=1 Tax=uncultured Fibrobacter sp. TaxID=261512 RepID=UPI0025FCE5F8|nr:hypothetical protein [uncultured Fibrobacter sp.]